MTAYSEEDVALFTDGHADAVVPCAGCNACCYSPVEVRPDFGDNPDDYQLAISVDVTAPNSLPMVTLDRKPDGSCYALKGGRCSIWAKRPRTCREFDCRRIFWMYDKAGRRELLAKGYFKRAVLDAGRRRADTLEIGPRLRAAAKRIGFVRISIDWMERRRGVEVKRDGEPRDQGRR